ncbi:hypothetical protein AB0Y39_05640 [Weissella paramesenteroides]|uniref:hypothetical protein n=1 Tax=Weissella paramesenteroides TaxID=1249 RepID=UPI003F233A41
MRDSEEIQAQLNLAASFFAKDYQERGVMKWQGFFLSDHTEDVAKYSEKRQARNHR